MNPQAVEQAKAKLRKAEKALEALKDAERHLRHLLNSYQKYYNEARTHLSLQKDAPIPRAVQTAGRTLAMPVLGGLHHQYFRA
jgi:hypothetical protein